MSQTWGQLGPENGLQLAQSTTVFAGTNSAPFPSEYVAAAISIMVSGEGLCPYPVDKTVVLLVIPPWLASSSPSLSVERRRKIFVSSFFLLTTKELVAGFHLG